jgi:hypothetical protein
MEDIREIRVSPVIAQIETIASQMRATIHQESMTRIRWMVGAIFSVSALVFSIIEFTG